ncbi:ABC transporter permease [Novosphingobium panipatense]|uniref:ABC transporter permease n=1 Tax=Novosphingobium panipatense TaxID=428991 RepID=UPI00361555F2
MPLNNAASSFEWFLSTLIYPAVLHLVAAVTSAMALGRELEGRSLGGWAARSGTIVPALFGKLLPYVGAASLWGIAWLLFVTLGRGWRVEGSVAAIVAGQTLFYLGTAAISALLVAATRETATALSVCAVYAGSALAYAGATLPLNGGSGFARFWSEVLPSPITSRSRPGSWADRMSPPSSRRFWHCSPMCWCRARSPGC